MTVMFIGTPPFSHKWMRGMEPLVRFHVIFPHKQMIHLEALAQY
jgi:hypothetical protein